MSGILMPEVSGGGATRLEDRERGGGQKDAEGEQTDAGVEADGGEDAPPVGVEQRAPEHVALEVAGAQRTVGGLGLGVVRDLVGPGDATDAGVRALVRGDRIERLGAVD